MSDIKAVTHEGNAYEIGKDYLFGSSGIIGKLKAIDTSARYPFIFLDPRGLENCLDEIHLLSADAGTITPAPIELINGAVYTFGYGNRLNAVGVYDKCEKRFYHLRGMYFGFEDCTNIRLMTVESK
tara:strand:+ start:77 stop:454 length:378 start_codon:yes stop_codon:yes gene_type:complete